MAIIMLTIAVVMQYRTSDNRTYAIKFDSGFVLFSKVVPVRDSTLKERPHSGTSQLEEVNDL